MLSQLALGLIIYLAPLSGLDSLVLDSPQKLLPGRDIVDKANDLTAVQNPKSLSPLMETSRQGSRQLVGGVRKAYYLTSLPLLGNHCHRKYRKCLIGKILARSTI